ncbi:Yip1-domain-containing protein [Coemansia reversa NRRL 1564]|uniref:Protein YIP n=1 Tax=Coemansia reversa (strain ATCC 12441 / NRRL 1564) TaxID=763665 RepID=A0A2G5BKG3_COERN|nr:Yip1-domain-containing protein [Coemansia reversa NRRL 1564]|eukprot:PIA19495.1 Yip1-domain-containing protein [Coemansia reversa NRRL 1564]
MSREEQLVDDDGFEIDSPFDTATNQTKRPDLSGSIGGRIGGGPSVGSGPVGLQQAYTSSTLPGGYHTNTLDEPILTTIGRDFGKVGRKTIQVLYPKGRDNALQEWDLWGPLFFCLSLAIIMSFLAPEQQESAVFTGVFALVCIGSCVVTLNCKLLGGHVSFFQSVCTLGYCISPMAIASLVTLLAHRIIVTLPVVAVAVGWSISASIGFLAGAQLANRRLLAVFPICLFYICIGWIIIIS